MGEKDLNTSFFEAVVQGNAQAVRLLLQSNRELTREKRKDDYAYQPEMELHAIKFLGAYIGAMTALQVAILLGHDEIAKDIIDATFKEDIDVPFGINNTALHLATLSGAKEVVRSLIEKGANKNFRNGKDFTPLDLADDPEISAILSEAPMKSPIRLSSPVLAVD